jgi:putative peptidoglycan lipid II flippase
MAGAVWLSAATMASRLLGLVREQVFAILVGANRFSDAFVIAFRIPNLLRDLFAEGALSSAFIPTFADYHRNRGPDSAFRLGNTIIALVLLVVGGVALLMGVFAGELVALLTRHGAEPEMVALATELTRVMMPFLPLVSLAAVTMGMLNAQKRFAAPALAPALFNVGSIAVGLGLWFAGVDPRTAVIGWSVGTLLGGTLQLLGQVPSLYRTGFRLRLVALRGALGEPGLRRIFRLMAASVIGLSAVQINVMVNSWFASAQEGANSWLLYGFRLMQLPLGVFGVAIATIAGSSVAIQAAEKDQAGIQRTLGSALRLVAFLDVPSAVGLVLLAHPIVALIYEHGVFTAQATARTAEALTWYAVGLYGYSAIKVLAPAFYALDRARVAVVGSFAGMATNVLTNVALYPTMGFRAAALGTALAATVNFLVLAVVWKVRHGGFPGAGIFRQLAQVGLATAAMGGAVVGVSRWLASVWPTGGGLDRLDQQLVHALVPVAVGAVVYLAAARVLGIAELSEIREALRRRRNRTRTSP